MSSDFEVHNLTRPGQVAGRARAAVSLGQRMRGLLGSRGLGPGQGLWISPCRQVHTFFMRFAIDVVFLDRGQRVVGVCRDLPPWRLSPWRWTAASALELGAGAARDIAVGDVLEFRPAPNLAVAGPQVGGETLAQGEGSA
ncbi:MAG: DUF192 domain-containing protein [Desulfarculus sp.]|nr:DUF192 domain-containing protein [Desulfarculus sp.]